MLKHIRRQVVELCRQRQPAWHYCGTAARSSCGNPQWGTSRHALPPQLMLMSADEHTENIPSTSSSRDRMLTAFDWSRTTAQCRHNSTSVLCNSRR